MLRHYNLRAVYLTLGPYRIGGFGADGGVEIEPAADFAERMKAADGDDTVLSYTNDLDAVVTITLHERSKGYREIGLLVAQVRKAVRTGAAIPDFAFGLDDQNNGDRMKAPRFGFLALPNMSKQKTAGDRVFRIVVPNGYEEAEFGTLNTANV